MEAINAVIRKIPRQKRSREKFHAILAACPVVIQQKGFANTSPADIAKVAGVATGTLYEYFPNKESICLTHMYLDMERTLVRIEELVQRNPKNLSRRKLELVFQENFRYVSENRELYQKIVDLLPHEGFINLIEDAQKKVIRIAKVVSWFYLGKENKPDLELMGYVLFNSIIGLIVRTLHTNMQMEPERLAAGVVEMIASYAATMGITIEE